MTEIEILRRMCSGLTRDIPHSDQMMACAWAVRRIAELEALLIAAPGHKPERLLPLGLHSEDCAATQGGGVCTCGAEVRS